MFPSLLWDCLHYCTMILHSFRIIVGSLWRFRIRPRTFAPEVWCATNEPPHLQWATKKVNIMILFFPMYSNVFYVLVPVSHVPVPTSNCILLEEKVPVIFSHRSASTPPPPHPLDTEGSDPHQRIRNKYRIVLRLPRPPCFPPWRPAPPPAQLYGQHRGIAPTPAPVNHAVNISR